MRYLTAIAHFLGAHTDVLLTKTLESVYAQCRSHVLRAIDA